MDERPSILRIEDNFRVCLLFVVVLVEVMNAVDICVSVREYTGLVTS